MATREETETETVKVALDKRLEEHDENRKVVLEKMHTACDDLKRQIEEMEERLTRELEKKFKAEDNRLQTALHSISSEKTEGTKELSKAMAKAKAELCVKQSYGIKELSLRVM